MHLPGVADGNALLLLKRLTIRAVVDIVIALIVRIIVGVGVIIHPRCVDALRVILQRVDFVLSVVVVVIGDELVL